MQKFNATNVVLNSIRLATPSVKVAGGGGICAVEKFCAVYAKSDFAQNYARRKMQKISRFAVF